jgi:hypothetical protein
MILGSGKRMSLWKASLAVTAMLTGSAQAVSLLSGNYTEWEYPGNVPAIATGATYSWTNGTDTNFPAGDPNLTKLIDGVSANGGGNSAVWGGWDNGAPAIVTFDLKSSYSIESVGLSAMFNSNNGVARVSVDLSSDGTTFTPWSSFTNPGSPDGNHRVLTVTGAASAAQYVRLTVERYVEGYPWYHQMVLGEAAIFGSAGSAPTWAVNASGDWNTASNWSAGVPNAAGAEARLTGAITSSKTIYTDTAVTLGALRIDNANTYVIAGSGTLIMDGGAASALVEVQTGTQKINLPLTIATNTDLSVAAAATLKISDPVTINSGKSLTQSGTGAVVYESTITVQPAASITMTGSTQARALTLQGVSNATVATHVGPTPSILQLDELSIDAGSTLDLKNNGLVVNSSAATVRSMIKSNAIDSTIATSTQDLGYVDLGSGKVAVGYTLLGDTDLNGQVASTDFNALVAGYGLTSGANWADGDVNYDDKVNTLDFNSLAGNFGATMSAAPELGRVVPEPAFSALLLAGAGLLIRKHH